MARPREFNQDEVLEKAMHLFWEKGYEATSVQDLVARTGVKGQSLYNVFGNKHDLYLKALERYRESGQEGLILLRSEQPIRDKLRAFFGLIVGALLADPCHRGCFMANTTAERAARDEKAACLVMAHLTDTETAFEQALVVAQRKGEIAGDKDAKALARFLFSSLQGLTIISKTAPERSRMNDIISGIIAALG